MTLFVDLLTPHSVADIRATVVQICAVVGLQVENLPRLSMVRKICLQVIPEVFYAVTSMQAEVIRGGLKDFAANRWLRELARQVYAVEPITETYATVLVTFTNPDGDPYNFVSKEVVVGNAITGKTYTNAARFALDAASGDADVVTVSMIATEPGSASNAFPGDVTRMVTVFGGVHCTNSSPGLGSDDEREESIRERMTLALGSFSPSGPADALAFIARSAVILPDGSYAVPRAGEGPIDAAVGAGVTRVQVLEHAPYLGDVSLYLADEDGPVSAEVVAGVHGLVMRLARAIGTNYLGTFPAVAVPVPVTYTAVVRASDGFTEAEVKTMIAAALARLFSSPRDAPVGGVAGFMYRSAILDAIKAAAPPDAEADDPKPVVDVPSAALIPAGNIPLAAGEVPQLGTITGTVTFI